jgi:hypothetical protein
MADFSRLPGPNADLWDWQLVAACRGVDSSLFFHPEGERGAARSAREAAAKEVCMRCPVRAECATHALAVREPYGVWGGLTEDEREAMMGRSRHRGVDTHDTHDTHDAHDAHAVRGREREEASRDAHPRAHARVHEAYDGRDGHGAHDGHGHSRMHHHDHDDDHDVRRGLDDLDGPDSLDGFEDFDGLDGFDDAHESAHAHRHARR